MLELRPSCEHCNKMLPPESIEAVICSFECTFCKNCAMELLANVCPNCGGGFCARPVRPQHNHKGGHSLRNYPASTRQIYQPVDLAAQRTFAKPIKTTPPEQR